MAKVDLAPWLFSLYLAVSALMMDSMVVLGFGSSDLVGLRMMSKAFGSEATGVI